MDKKKGVLKCLTGVFRLNMGEVWICLVFFVLLAKEYFEDGVLFFPCATKYNKFPSIFKSANNSSMLMGSWRGVYRYSLKINWSCLNIFNSFSFKLK